LIVGGFTLDGSLLPASSIFDWSTKSFINKNMLLREKRKFHSCTKFNLSSGRASAVIVGGQNEVGDAIESAEIFYIDASKWVLMPPLPRPLYSTSLINVNQRLLCIGGLNTLTVERKIWTFNELNGWHLSNLRLDTPTYGHVSFVLNEENFYICRYINNTVPLHWGN
jgi:hypothetical protein